MDNSLLWTAPCLLYPWARNDADTRKILVAVGPESVVRRSLRIHGVDTPEKLRRFTSTPEELKDFEVEVASLVSEATDAWCAERSGHALYEIKTPNGHLIFDYRLHYIGCDKYAGRILGDLYAPDTAEGEASLKAFLLESGMARSYDGGHKEPWTEDQLHDIRSRALTFMGRPTT